ncbi:hypothetical protein F4821DRAFT_264470 [Hypoxylon rubiginosum]|uniref:Uncharacterized protein n=1 Tax=Hypoxylon rubiginosum TaxID=110542 RepID=A0ACC0CNM1_9PEZI|nr:hypothetical protein F4821DRAFT_264470 [Hypoxylon rubiginosum]
MSSTAISNSGLNNDNIAINRSRENVVQQIQHIDTFTDGVLQHLSATNISVEEEGDMPTRSSDIQGASAPDHPAPTVSPMSTVSSSPRHLPNGLTSQLMPIRKPVPKTVASYQETMLSKAGLSWRPVYLRRRVLLAFAVIFTIIVVAIEALAYISTMNQGLVAGQYRLQYLWKYGPTAILSVVMALWGRVEYQSKSTAPWYRLWSGPQGASRSVLLDYISPILPVAVYQAIKHKDYIVASTIIISLLLRAIVIFSTSFISLVPTQVIVSSVPVTLGNTFKDVADTWSSPWGQEIGSFTAQLYNSLSAGQTKYPAGLQDSFAYQDFSVDMTPFNDITVATDAFFGNLKCHESNYINISIHDTIRSSESRPQAYNVGNCTVEFDVTFPQNISDLVIYGRSELSLCEENYHKYPGGSSAPALYESNFTLQVYFMKVSYENRTTKGRNDTYQSGVIDKWLEKTCTPSHMLRKIAVTRAEGGSDRFVTIDQPHRALPETKPWSSLLDLNDMFNRGTDGMITNSTWVQTPNGSPLAINLDGLLSHVIDKQTMTNSPDIVESIFGSSMVEDKFNDVFKSYASFLGFMYFQQPTSGFQSNASATTTQNRLLVTIGAAHTMAGLSGLCLLLLAAMIATIPKYGILPRNPTTIIGMAALISPSKRFTSSLENMGSMSEKNIRSRLGSAEYRAYASSHENSYTGRSFYLNTLQSADDNVSSTTEKEDNRMRYPIVLHPVYRLVACLCVVGIVVTLESLLRKSTSNDGLSDLIKADDTPYGWTLLPAVVLSLVSIYYGAIESQIRLLSPYNNLLRGSKFDLTLALDLTDRLAITSLIASTKLRLYATITSIATSFVAFFLTIAASSLFTPVEVSNVVNTTQLPALDTFNYATFWDAHGSGGSRILGANIEYSPFTYADLVLPHLQLRGQLFDEAANITLDNIYTTAMVPAARSYLSCKTFESSELQATFTPVYDPVNGSPLDVIIGNDNGTNLTIQVTLESQLLEAKIGGELQM